MLTIGTAVFQRIVQEARDEVAKQCKQVLVEIMSQTPRFGCFTREYNDRVAEQMISTRIQK